MNALAVVPDETTEARITYAVGLTSLDFDILSLWSTWPDGRCRCPKGAACDKKPGKHPIAPDGTWQETRDPAKVRTMLSAGSQPNYGVIPPTSCFAWDVDGTVGPMLDELAAKHGPLPATYGHASPNGEHRFYRWPAEIERPASGNLFGIVTRWPNGDKGRGYVVGPYSRVGAKLYRLQGDPHHIADLPEAWALAARESARGPRPAITSIETGHRHPELRDAAYYLHKRGFDGPALRAAIDAMNAALPEPKTDAQVTQAIGDLAPFPPDPPDVTVTGHAPTVARPPEVLAPMSWADLLSEPAAPPPMIRPGIPEVGVTILAGSPKAGKTLLASQFALEARRPVLLIIEEGSRTGISYRLRHQAAELGIESPPVTLLHRQRIRLDDRASVAKLRAYVAETRPALIVVDPLNRLHSADENKPSQMTPIMDALAELAYDNGGRAVVAIHHLNKPSADRRGDIWDRLRGASSIRSGTDANLILDGDKGTYRKLAGEFRDAEPLIEHMDLDRTALLFRRAEAPEAPSKVDPLALRLFVDERTQVTSAEVMARFGVSKNTALYALRALGCDEYEGVRRRLTFSLATVQ